MRRVLLGLEFAVIGALMALGFAQAIWTIAAKVLALAGALSKIGSAWMTKFEA